MARIDPNADTGGGTSRKCSPGRKVLAAVGLDRSETQKGSPTLEVHWVCVKDLDAPAGANGEKGYEQWDTFVLTDAARWRMGQVAKALGHAQPFDDEVDDDLMEVFTKGYAVATLEEETNPSTGKVQVRVKRYEAFTGAEGNDWPDLIGRAEREHDRYRDAARKKRVSKFVPVGVASSGAAATDAGNSTVDDDDLPF
jgi:hypothetical protein